MTWFQHVREGVDSVTAELLRQHSVLVMERMLAGCGLPEDARRRVAEETEQRLWNFQAYGMTHPEISGLSTSRYDGPRFFAPGSAPEVDYTHEPGEVPTFEEMWQKMEALGTVRERDE